MNLENYDKVLEILQLEPIDLWEIIHDMNNKELFIFWILNLDHLYNTSSIFKEHNITIHSKVKPVSGHDTLYSVLKKRPFTNSEKELFHFVAIRLLSNRTLKEGELL